MFKLKVVLQICFLFSPISQVRLSTKQNLSFYSTKPLSFSKCQNLANHYLGFGGWSTHIITVSSSNIDDIHQIDLIFPSRLSVHLFMAGL